MKGPKKFYVIIIFIILTLSSLIILWNITDNILSRRAEQGYLFGGLKTSNRIAKRILEDPNVDKILRISLINEYIEEVACKVLLKNGIVIYFFKVHFEGEKLIYDFNMSINGYSLYCLTFNPDFPQLVIDSDFSIVTANHRDLAYIFENSETILQKINEFPESEHLPYECTIQKDKAKDFFEQFNGVEIASGKNRNKYYRYKRK